MRAGKAKVFGAYLTRLARGSSTELRLGKKAERAATPRPRAAPPARPLRLRAAGIRFGEADVDQARAAGVLIEFEHGTPVVVDRALYRELAKGAIVRTVEELRSAGRGGGQEKTARRVGKGRPTR